MHGQSAVTTYLFTDIEGSTRLWEQEPERMRPALARHDALTREAVEANRGRIVKTTGDGFHAVFDDPLDALGATLQLQLSLADPEMTGGVPLQVRSGLHAGVDERRDNDFYGPVINRAARIMRSAHGGQILVSQAVAALIGDRLPKKVALRDLGRVRLRDLTSVEVVYQVVHPNLRQDFPVLRSLEATPNNLPQQVTSFIGRERELAEVKKLLRETRLLTLIGVGGLGKTRLSLQVAAHVMDDYSDGVWFVELAALTDERLVPQAIASALGVKEEAGRPVVEALMKYVKDRRLLLILDNCEHLVRSCAELAKGVLQAGPHAKVLASSRERLRVAGETTYPLSPMSIPNPSASMSAQALNEYEAVQLFVSRAEAAQPAFVVNDQNAAAIAEICYRLDGIPLAIELAAARVRSLSPDAIATRLSDRFRLLIRGDQTALPRQQTLRALIDWSYDLLTEQERVFLRRLSVFSGGWSLETAEAVAPGASIAEDHVLELLTLLVEKSLVVLESGGERYRLLDTVQQYALERLREADEERQFRTRHLEFFLALAEKARQELVGPNQGAWLARLDLDAENLLAAHAWCDHAENSAEMGLRLVNSVKFYWPIRGLLGLGHRVTMEALSREGAQTRTIARCRTLHTVGQLGFYMGHYANAQTQLEAGLSIAREIGDDGRIAAILQTLGLVSLGQRDLERARQHLNEALNLARKIGNKRELAGVYTVMAHLHRVEGALELAEPLYEEALALAAELGDQESVAIVLLNLAMVSIGRGSGNRASTMLLKVLAIAKAIGSKQAGLSTLEVSAGLASSRSEWLSAARYYGAAEAQTKHTGIQRDPADDAFLAPLVAKARATIGAATFADAEALGKGLSYDDAIVEARTWLENLA